MAAPPLCTTREEASPLDLKSYLLDFAKYQEQNPGLSPSESAERFCGGGAAGQCAAPAQNEAASSDLRVFNRTNSCPGGSQPTAPERMSHSGSTSSYLAPTSQQTFAYLSGRSPRQFRMSNAVRCRPGYETAVLSTSQKVDPRVACFDDNHLVFKMDSENSTMANYLGQQDSSEPFPLARQAVGDTATAFCGNPMNKEYSLTADGSPNIFAPRMQNQLSNSTSGYQIRCDENYLDSSGPLSHPMTRHSRSRSNASHKSRSSYLSSQAESASPTDHFTYLQNCGVSMSRQTSNASLTHGAMMLKVSSSAGNSASGNGGEDYESACGRGDMGRVFSEVGPFASDADLSSSLDKVTGQHVLKRASSMTVEDLDHLSATLVEHEMRRDPSTASESVKSRKSKRVKEGAEPPAQNEGARIETPEKEGRERQTQRKTSGSSANRQRSAEKTTQREPGGTTGGGGGRALAASRMERTTSSQRHSATRSVYIRPPHPRVYCKLCNENPDGFRGDHELRRHTDREHASTRTMFVIKDISEDGQFLAKCKACQSRKKYGCDYNAAAHLRRQHFNPKKGAKKEEILPNQSEPNMTELRDWIEGVIVTGEQDCNKESTDTDAKSDGESEENPPQVAQSEKAPAANSAAVIQDGVLDTSNAEIPPELLLLGTDWEQLGNWYGTASPYDQHIYHSCEVQCSATGGSLPLVEALDHQHENNMALHEEFMMQKQQATPFMGGDTANSIFSSLQGPAIKDASGIYNDDTLGEMAPVPGLMFEVDGLEFS